MEEYDEVKLYIERVLLAYNVTIEDISLYLKNENDNVISNVNEIIDRLKL